MKTERKCTKCEKVKALDDFYRSKKGSFGRVAVCKSCCREYSLVYYQKNKERQYENQKRWRKANRAKLNEKARIYRAKNVDAIRVKQAKSKLARTRGAWSDLADPQNVDYVVRLMLNRARHSAKKKGIPFNLTKADILPFPKVCPVLGTPLIYGATRAELWSTPSLDRIDNSRGYVKGNVVLVSYRANVIKGDATVSELEKLHTFYKKLVA
jgi:hypothetical protein